MIPTIATAPQEPSIDLENPQEGKADGETLPEAVVGVWGRMWQVFDLGIGALLPSAGLGSTAYAIYGYVVAQTTPSYYVPAGLATGAAVAFFTGGCRVFSLIQCRQLENKVKDLMQQNILLNKANVALQITVDKLKKLEEEWKTGVDEAKKQNVTLNKTLTDRTKELSTIQEDLTKTVGQLNTVNKLYQQFKEGVVSAAKEMDKFKTENKIFQDNVTELTKHVSKLGDNGSFLSQQVTQAENSAQFFMEQNASLEELLEYFKKQTISICEDYKKAKEELESFNLKENITKLDEADDKFFKGAKLLGEIRKEYQEEMKKIKDLDNMEEESSASK